MHFNIHKNESYDNSLKARKGKKNESILLSVSYSVKCTTAKNDYEILKIYNINSKTTS